ncbi:MAG: DUF1801 domain-containing protein [Myxococcales bacterium]|mgnify:CR=1 FL=1|jgi:uncharacterized protein YdhG (YjbR/CyaY superfamily)|nr:DUF1801 domain-containing protein [Myxococcales bacterium]MBL0196014.1 DUF1801 domain-containing protein [Myxococcales bacterium]HQY61117.1 DUF1801 domain-containing protein [Polyangiaceae bacterium]
MAGTAADIDAYISQASPVARSALEEIRRGVKEAVPSAIETFSYGMPALRLTRTFFYFGAFKKHVGIYPPVRDDAALIEATSGYRNAKGNLTFPLDRPIPYALIVRVAVALSREYAK